jgi:exopolysaccharide biosynthesis polyprenyl glycosylphosphotransferase
MLRTNIITLFIGDFAVFVGGLFVALMIRYRAIPESNVVIEHLEAFLGVIMLWLAVFLIAGLYEPTVNLSRKAIPGIVFRAQTVNLALAALVFFIFPIGITPKVTLAIYLLVTTLLIVWWRLFVFPSLTLKKTERALMIGSGEDARGLATILNEGRFFSFMSAEVVDPTHFRDKTELETALRAYIGNHHVSMIIGDMHSEYASSLVPLYYELAFRDERVTFLSLHDLYEQVFNRIPPSLVRESWMLEHISLDTHTVGDALKRMFDIVGALLLGIVTFPLLPCIALAIKLDDGGPLLYRTERIGRFNQAIHILKFRTMNGRDRGDDALKSTLTITRVGKILRTTRLDELPQIWNVLKGDLSFIGPRPEMPALAAVYSASIPYYTMRHLIKPGLSGWAQINEYEVPRSGVDIDRTITKLSFDLYYLKRRSLFLDLEIALKTIRTLLARSGT